MRELAALADEALAVVAAVAVTAVLGAHGLLPQWVPWAVAAVGGAVLALLAIPILRGRARGYSYLPIGEAGVAVSRLDPVGLVKVRGEIWKAICVECRAEEGDPVEVVGYSDALEVKPRRQGRHEAAR